MKLSLATLSPGLVVLFPVVLTCAPAPTFAHESHMVQADAPFKRGRSGSNDRRVQTAWPRDVVGLSNLTPAVGQDKNNLLAREMEESLRQLLAARYDYEDTN